jgi:hypothetical protein
LRAEFAADARRFARCRNDDRNAERGAVINFRRYAFFDALAQRNDRRVRARNCRHRIAARHRTAHANIRKAVVANAFFQVRAVGAVPDDLDGYRSIAKLRGNICKDVDIGC